ncbi:MAG TPA: IS110 family transposase [Mycobacteriales bacterium]|jgi:transposase|nr:IS110 family transposase [Mycobacteriales bacterium]
MPIVADVADLLVGFDTHRDAHQMTIATPAAHELLTVSISNDEAGFSRAIEVISVHAPGPAVFIGIEGSRSYGIGLLRALRAAGFPVIEVEQPARKDRRGVGKSDQIDAMLAVKFLAGCDLDRLPTPRGDGDRDALRILLIAREELTTASTAATNRLRALLLTGDDRDRSLARGRLPLATLTAIRRRRPTDVDRAGRIRHDELRRLATDLTEYRRRLKANNTQLTEIVQDMAPRLLQLPGVGPVSAATAILAFSHPGRVRDDAAFAALAGVNPLPASSGRTTRHRLNRGGDRNLNKAIYTIAITRERIHPDTKAYIARRTTQGLTRREIRRCLKRYIARQLYRELNTALAT